jgi:hypothetical protein
MSNLTSEEVGIKTLINSILEEAFDQRIKTLEDFYHLTGKIKRDELGELTEEQVKLKNSCLALLTKIK